MISIWIAAAAAYAAFYFWYNGRRRPLAPHEVEDYIARLRASAVEASAERLETLRAFLASDDGGEFYMVNLIRLHPGTVRGPGEESARPADTKPDGVAMAQKSKLYFASLDGTAAPRAVTGARRPW